MRAKAIFTHNPQDFYSGSEPDCLVNIIRTERMSELGFKIFRGLEEGYQVIVVKDEEDDGRAEYICKT